MTPAGFTPPCAADSHGAASHVTPANPISSATIVKNVGRVPPGHAHSVSTMQSGLTPMMSAVMPEGTYCSAQTTRPLPPKRRKMPMTVLASHWRAVGHAAPRSLRNPNKSEPASVKRTAAIRNGGIVSTAILMPRYVLPQRR